MAATVKKGDICAIVTTTVAQPAFGSGRKPITYHDIALVRVESATKAGLLTKYRTMPASPVYPHANRYGCHRVMCISGINQLAARKLFERAASPTDLTFSDVEAVRTAILAVHVEELSHD